MNCFRIFSVFLLFTQLSSAETFEFAVSGDSGVTSRENFELKESIIKEGVNRMILAGDNNYSGQPYPNIWDHWTQSGVNFDVVAIGNHNRSYAEEVDYFHMPAEYYSMEFGKHIRFIVLNSDNERTANEQTQWFNDQMEKTTEKFVFVVYHHPTYSTSNHHHWWEKEDFQTQMRLSLKKYRNKITALFVGHDHMVSFHEVGTLPMIVSGGGTKARSASAYEYQAGDGTEVKTDWLFNGARTWVKLTVDDTNDTALVDALTVSENNVRCTLKLKTGVKPVVSQNCKDTFHMGKPGEPASCYRVRRGRGWGKRCPGK